MSLASCGLETLTMNSFGGDHPAPIPPPETHLLGSVALAGAFGAAWKANPVLLLRDGAGNTVAPVNIDFPKIATATTVGLFDINLPTSTDFNHLRVAAIVGAAVVEAVAPSVMQGTKVTIAAPLDTTSTAASLVAQALARLVRLKEGAPPAQLSLTAIPGPGNLDPLLEPKGLITAAVSANGAGVQLAQLVGRSIEAAVTAPSSAGPVLGTVRLGGDGKPTAVLSDTAVVALDKHALNLDLNGDSVNDTSDEAEASLDAALVAAIKDLKLTVCLDPQRIRTLVSVDFNAGRLDGNCRPLDRFRSLDPKEIAHDSRQIFFAGGIHADSPVQDQTIHQMLGAWVPNVIPMYDDGTHGDEKAGDNIWTVQFDLPAGAIIAYKYTYGTPGQGWTGTEEWPGNQRLLRIEDKNGDGLVARRDLFGDETSNKDKSNALLPSNGGKGTLDSKTSPFAAEMPIDPAGLCKATGYWMPAAELLTTTCH